jgi:hypothetical protein
MKRFTLLYCLWSLLLLSSCETMNQVTINCLQPGVYNFPSDIKKVAIVNNTPYNNGVPKAYNDGNKGNKTESYFFTNGKNTAESLAKSIADQNYFDEVVICDSVLRNDNDIDEGDRILTLDEVNALTYGLKVDAIISLDNVEMNISREINTAYEPYEGSLDAVIRPTVRVYVPSHLGPIMTVQNSDTLSCIRDGATIAEVESMLPTNAQVIEDAAGFAGQIPVKQMLPHWTNNDRVYFSNGVSSSLQDAASCVRNNKWDAAFNIWKGKYDKTNNQSMKMKMAFNIALYYEMQNNIDEAINWATKSKEHAVKANSNNSNYFKTSLANTYLTILKERSKDIDHLNIQMNRFKNEVK